MGKTQKIVLSEITRPGALIFSMQHLPLNLDPICSKYGPAAKNGLSPGVACITQAYMGKTQKIFLSETTRPGALIFGMQHLPVNLEPYQ